MNRQKICRSDDLPQPTKYQTLTFKLNSERMKTAKQILSDITGYTVDELTERNTEPLLQAEDCLTAMYCFLAQQQANGVESDSNCNIPFNGMVM